jgi:EAL domain-containing protein (putative c-di-GMP-specific phosphodiesterase class I)
VDRSFVSGLGGGGNDAAIVSAMVELARSLRLAVVAEGVETQAELDMVKRAGCDEAQGYLLGRPGPI